MLHRVGILGLGLMGTRMAGALARHATFRVEAGFDRDAALTASWCEEQGARAARDTADLLAANDIDLVYIATPPASHVPLARLALAAGKAVLVEKPLAVNLQEASELCQLVEAGHGRLWMHFPFATLPGLSKVQSELTSGRFGAPLRVEIELQFSQWPRTWHHAGPWLAGAQEGGFCREVLSHFVFLTQSLLGPLLCTYRNVEYGALGTETRVHAEFRAGAVPVSVMAGIAGGAPDFNRWTLFGEQRSFRVEDWSHVAWGDATGFAAHIPKPGEEGGLVGFLDQWAQALAGARHTLPGARDGYHVMRAVEALLER